MVIFTSQTVHASLMCRSRTRDNVVPCRGSPAHTDAAGSQKSSSTPQTALSAKRRLVLQALVKSKATNGFLANDALLRALNVDSQMELKVILRATLGTLVVSISSSNVLLLARAKGHSS